MQITTNFQRIESIVFKFDDNDIKQRLLESLRPSLDRYIPKGKTVEWEIDWFDEEGRLYVDLTARFMESEPARDLTPTPIVG